MNRGGRRARLARGLIALALLAVAMPARADRAKAKVAVVVVSADDDKLAPARQATIQVSMERAVARDARLEVVDQDEALAASAGLVPKDAVAEALAGVLAWAQKQELAQAQFLRGAAHAVLGDDKAAIEEFVSLLAWRPDFAADPTIAPAVVIPLWEKAQARARQLPGGSIDVTSAPSGGMAYIDGRFVGFTPTTIEALPVGTHYLTVRKYGHQKVVRAVRVSDKRPATAEAELAPSPRADELQQAIATLRAGLGAAQAPAEMQGALGDLSELLGVDQVAVLVAPRTGDRPYRAYVYNALGGQRLAQAELRPDQGDLEDALATLATSLYKQVSFDPPPPPPPPRIARHGRPFWRRGWFWASVGTALAVGVLVPLAIHERGPAEPRCPGADSCGAVILRF
ncbi:MAG: PEGA domain-containing protein [Deltaproteobacteria bacterium]|nr:PEGA domain-containing protein [Deltaproteobacteria bacterium]